MSSSKPDVTATHELQQMNPEAGVHDIPSDPVEIHAALVASKAIWEKYPYFGSRFGERGKRFADSDLCWLVSLCHLTQADAQQQVDWLCTVLATRGMPTLLMEETLHCLAETLIHENPEQQHRYQTLLTVSEHLKRRRLQFYEQHLPEHAQLTQELDQWFSPKLKYSKKDSAKALDGDQVNDREGCEDMAPLLLSSIADEQLGIAGAIAAFQSWIIESGRFTEACIAKVNDTVARLSSPAHQPPE